MYNRKQVKGDKCCNYWDQLPSSISSKFGLYWLNSFRRDQLNEKS